MEMGALGPQAQVRGGRAGRAVAAGLVGAGAVTLLNEMGRRVLEDAPRIEVLGERGVRRVARRLGARPRGRDLFRLALAGDLLSNAAYYAPAGLARRPIRAGLLLGVLAGAGAVWLPERLGLGAGPTRRTVRRAALAFGWYLAAGLAAGAVGRALAPRPPDWTL